MVIMLEASQQKRRVSREDYLALPLCDWPAYEWERGEMVEMMPAHSRHGLAIKRFSWLFQEIEAQGRGVLYVDTRVDMGDRYYFPDLTFVVPEGPARHDPDSGMIAGPPYLAVEILSETTAARDRVTKFNAYLGAGVPWYWLVDPVARTVEEFGATQGGYIRTAAAGPGEVFRPQAFPGLEKDLDGLLPSPE